MGRHAPEQEYEIVFCKGQQIDAQWGTFDPTTNFSLTAGTLRIKNGISTVSYEIGSSGFVTGPGMLSYVTDDKVAHINFDPVTVAVSGRTLLQPFYVLDESRIKYVGTSLNQLPKLTGINQTTTAIGEKPYYTKLDSSGGIILFNGSQSTASITGYQVSLRRLNLEATGVTLGSSYIIPDTLNSGTAGAATGNTARYVIPSIALDTSYTGDVKRVLVGYVGITGTTSGKLCARLAEISGDVVTYGDPVIIRSTVGSGTFRQSIDVTYHSSGVDSNCFVIATAVEPGNLAVLHSTSGELIACNPPSGLVLSGYFGTAVTLGSGTSSGSATQLSAVKCTSMNSTTGAGGGAVGYATSIQGQTSGTATGLIFTQKYFVSGTTITTGSIASIVNGSVNNFIESSGTSATNVPGITFISPATTSATSGVFILNYVLGTGTSSLYTSATGSGFTSIYGANITTGTSPFATLLKSYADATNRGGAGRRQDPYIISGNPYSGGYFSAFQLEPHIKTSTGFLSLNISRVDTTGAVSNSICEITTGDYFNSGITTSGASYRNIIDVKGTFPNYEYVVTLSGLSLNVFNFGIGASGEKWRNAGFGFSGYSNNSSVADNYGYKTPLGQVIGITGFIEDTGIVRNNNELRLYYSAASGTNSPNKYLGAASGSIVTKVAKTEAERRRLSTNYVTGVILIDSRNQLENV